MAVYTRELNTNFNYPNIDILNVFSMGDFSDGILRVSQLMKLRYGVVDGTIKYADFISNKLNSYFLNSKVLKRENRYMIFNTVAIPYVRQRLITIPSRFMKSKA